MLNWISKPNIVAVTHLQALESFSLLGSIQLNRQSFIDDKTKNGSTLITLVMSGCHSAAAAACGGYSAKDKKGLSGQNNVCDEVA